MAILLKREHLLKNRAETLKFQILLHNFLNDYHMSDNEVEALVILADKGFTTESKDLIIKEKIFKSPISIENFISKMVRKKFLEKTGKGERVFTSKLNLDLSENSIVINLVIGNVGA